MRNPLLARAPDTDTVECPLDGSQLELSVAVHAWLDSLEPFAIEWELIWLM
jgi:hypothetical protein